MKTKKYIIILFSVVLLGTSCSDDFFNVKLTQALSAEDAIAAIEADPNKLVGFVDALYNLMVEWNLMGTGHHDSFGFMSILHSTDMMTEDIVMPKLSWFRFDYALDNREWNYRRTNTNWTYFYSLIAGANTVLGLTNAESNNATIQAYRGQAYAIRGMSYFYLIQMYQHLFPIIASGDKPGVPMYWASNEGKQDILSRASVSAVLSQIESDLLKAVASLDGFARANKNQINQNVANGLLARYYLLTEQWGKAVTSARAAQVGFPIMPISSLKDGFIDINNSEWMWGFAHNSQTTSVYASLFSHLSNLTPGYAGLDYAPRLIDRRLYDNIPATDARKEWFQDEAGSITNTPPAHVDATTWQLPYANLKFGWAAGFTQDYLYMRAAEMVLIEAEALARQPGRGGEAAIALKKLMERRDPTWNLSTVTVDQIWMQRRIELWGEGFAYFDLKRMNRGIDRSYEGTNHEAGNRLTVLAGDRRWIYRLPQGEIQENSEISEEDNNE